MNAFRTIKSVYLPSYGNTFSVGKDNVSAIAKTTDGVIIYYIDTPTAKAASRIPSVSRWDSQVTNRPQSISVLDSP